MGRRMKTSRGFGTRDVGSFSLLPTPATRAIPGARQHATINNSPRPCPCPCPCQPRNSPSAAVEPYHVDGRRHRRANASTSHRTDFARRPAGKSSASSCHPQAVGSLLLSHKLLPHLIHSYHYHHQTPYHPPRGPHDSLPLALSSSPHDVPKPMILPRDNQRRRNTAFSL